MKWKLNRDCFKIDFGFKHKIFLCFIFLFFYFLLFNYYWGFQCFFSIFCFLIIIGDFTAFFSNLLDLFKLFSPIAFYTMINI